MVVHPPDELGLLLLAVAFAIGVALLIQRLKLPYTITLVLAGLGLGAFAPLVTDELQLSRLLSAELLLFFILPPLLFDGASKIGIGQMRRNWRAISMLALPGVLVNMLLIGGLVWGIVWGFDPDRAIWAFLLGAIVAPTDPVSVLALFKSTGVPHRLSLIVEGESLFNDGTGIVLFQVMLALLLTTIEGDPVGLGSAIAQGLASFVAVVAIGLLLGAGLGWLAVFALRMTRNHLLEVTVSVALAFGAFYCAEVSGGSGVIATVVAGLVIGNIGKLQDMTPQARVALDHFWEEVAFVLNSVLFLLIGFEIADHISPSWRALGLGLVAILGATLARFIVYPIFWASNRMRDSEVPRAWQHVVFWGGLRGSIPLALLLILGDVLAHDVPAGELAHHTALYGDLLVMAFSVVLFTLIVQGLTLGPLIGRLRLGQSHDDRSQRFEQAVGELVAARAAVREIRVLRRSRLVGEEHAQVATQEQVALIDDARARLGELVADKEFAARLKTRLQARLLAVQQKAISDAELAGLVSGRVSEEMRWHLDTNLALLLDADDLGGEIPLPHAEAQATQ